MRETKFNTHDYFLIKGRSLNGSVISKDESDKARFVYLLTHFQAPIQIFNIGWHASKLLESGSLSRGSYSPERIIKQRSIELVAFAVIGDSFELICRNLDPYVISVYMPRVS